MEPTKYSNHALGTLTTITTSHTRTYYAGLLRMRAKITPYMYLIDAWLEGAAMRKEFKTSPGRSARNHLPTLSVLYSIF